MATVIVKGLSHLLCVTKKPSIADNPRVAFASVTRFRCEQGNKLLAVCNRQLALATAAYLNVAIFKI